MDFKIFVFVFILQTHSSSSIDFDNQCKLSYFNIFAIIIIPALINSTEIKKCPRYMFDCGNGECISSHWKCDEYKDCSNGKWKVTN